MAFATQKNSLKDIIKLNYKGILENCKVSNKHTFVRDIVSKEFHMNPKSGMRFSKFKEQINNAIHQEKSLEQDLHELENKIGSNIGKIIGS